MSQLLMHIRIAVLVCLGLLGLRCTNRVDDNQKFNVNDTTQLVQAVLNDDLLKAEIIRDFGEEPLKLVAGPVIKPDMQLTFANKFAQVVSLREDARQIHERYPKKLYVSVPSVKLFGEDSATVRLLFHAGNATARFSMKNSNRKWIVVNREYGKL
ncbi:hypothetical protein [Spirosoma montaniterrae]|uniref:Uncharacterized protein n=1 Tax=Spirosoma montaniterrae TaxID=1178516 RepID=A0A1P9WZ98_9BACT|nr:hypothetical protein [Spirosoma montaniterrae]AQG80648.1 hypothetical protein AWR27_15740 [Spirosoma montaniterrae]